MMRMLNKLFLLKIHVCLISHKYHKSSRAGHIFKYNSPMKPNEAECDACMISRNLLMVLACLWGIYILLPFY